MGYGGTLELHGQVGNNGKVSSKGEMAMLRITSI